MVAMVATVATVATVTVAMVAMGHIIRKGKDKSKFNKY